MHREAYDWVRAQVSGTHLADKSVVEVGSRRINGSVRPLFAGCAAYIGVDAAPGRDVDVVADLHSWSPASAPDMVVCCEVLEHDPGPKEAFHRMASWLKPKGLLLVTCATTGRVPHACSGAGRIPVGEHYGNVTEEMLALAELPGKYEVEKYERRGDLYIKYERAA